MAIEIDLAILQISLLSSRAIGDYWFPEREKENMLLQVRFGNVSLNCDLSFFFSFFLSVPSAWSFWFICCWCFGFFSNDSGVSPIGFVGGDGGSLVGKCLPGVAAVSAGGRRSGRRPLGSHCRSHFSSCQINCWNFWLVVIISSSSFSSFSSFYYYYI